MSKIKLKHSSGNSMSIGAPATNPASDLELKLPATVGTAGQALVNSSTAGTLEFATVVKSGDGKSTNTTSVAGDVGYSFENTNTTSGFGMKIKGGGTDADRYIVRFDDAAGNERARIQADGKFFFNTTSAGPHGGHFNIDSSASSTNGLNVKGTTGNYVMISSSARNGGHHIYFSNRQSGSDVNTGSISDNNSNVSYNTSSDYRIKENIVSISDGITRVKQLNPVRHTWKTNPAIGTVDGWIAHEVDAICPDAVDGVKDAVNDDGSIYPQAVDYGRITPLLTAALKEAIAKIEVLETEVAALKSS